MDARRQSRTPLIYNLKVENPRSGEAVGYLVNIDPDGMMLLSDREPQMHATLSLCIHLPQNVMGGGCIEVSGQAVWCRHEAENKYHVGFKFVEVPDGAVSRVSELVHRFYEAEKAQIDQTDPYLQNTDLDDIT